MRKMIFSLFCCVIAAPSFIFPESPLPKLIMHFDMNGTLILCDKAGAKTKEYVVLHALAGKYKEKWDESLPEPISYVDYVKDYLYPAFIADPNQKKLRSQKIEQFLHFLEETNHPLKDKVHEEYTLAFSKLQAQKTLVLPSFYLLLEHLQEKGVDFSVVIRTFGHELDDVMKEIKKHSALSFSKWAYFDEEILQVPGDSPIQTAGEFYVFLKDNRHIGIQDDWRRWFKSGEKREFGKLFPMDLEDAQTISLFFDDNIECSSDKNIINPIDIKTNQSLDIPALMQAKRAFAVSSLEALMDDQYYVHLVEEALDAKAPLAVK